MLAAIDIGNTNITIGLFEGSILKGVKRLDTQPKISEQEYKKAFQEIFNKFNVTDCIIASVVDEITEKINRVCDSVVGCKSFVLNTSAKLGITLDVENPEKMGADRIANAAIVHSLYQTPIIVIDAGTATTFDIISKDGRFYGGIIMPGVELQMKALYQNTSKLPKIKIQESPQVIGIDTETCMLSGVVRGSACAIEGLLSQCEKEIGEDVTVIGTGGHIELLRQYISRKIDYVNKDLTLQGLQYIYDLNRKM